MDKSLFISMTGASQNMLAQGAHANNLANVSTPGFQRDFEQARSMQVFGETHPTRVYAMTERAGTEMSGGPLMETGRELDVAIRGEGFFLVQLPDGRTAYTRDGSFERDATGQLVNVNGHPIQPGVTVPDGASSISIGPDGTVEAFLNNDPLPTQIGQLQLARFVNKAGLESIGDNLFVETGSSGPAQIGVASADGMGNMMQGYLEMANVNAVTEIADLIAAQRAYEMNARVVSGADEMLQATSQLR